MLVDITNPPFYGSYIYGGHAALHTTDAKTWIFGKHNPTMIIEDFMSCVNAARMAAKIGIVSSRAAISIANVPCGDIYKQKNIEIAVAYRVATPPYRKLCTHPKKK